MEAAEVVEEQDAESAAAEVAAVKAAVAIHSAKDSKNAGRTEKG